MAYFNALEVANLGHEVHIFTAALATGQDVHVYPEAIQVNNLWTPLRIGNAPLTPGLLSHLRQYDIVHLHWPYIFGAEFTWLANLLYGFRYVLTYHLDLRSDRREIFGLYQKIWGPQLAKKARKIIAVTSGHLQTSAIYPFVKHRPQDICEIPNGVDTDLFHPKVSGHEVRDAYNIPHNHFVILFVGAMDKAHEYKGVPDLIKAFAKLPIGNCSLLLVGGGDLLQTYQTIVSYYPEDIQSRVVFTDRIGYFQLPAYYAASDVCILPSRQPESFGMVLIEAMALSKPVIASLSPGVTQVVDDGINGLLFPVEDTEALTQSIKLLLDKSSAELKRMGESGRAKVEKLYSWQAIGKQLVDLYQDILS